MAIKCLVDALRSEVGKRYVLTGASALPYATGFRTGVGPVAAVVRPGSLVELWRSFRLCIAADCIVIGQAANTGLTGGSTPFGDYDRPVVIINTLRLKGIYPVRGGREVICLAGATLYDLEQVLAPLGREPHSVIGSSCIGASVVGGICNSSGGALVSRGPAYTEYALFAQVDKDGEVHLCNHLGVALSGDPEAILRKVEAGGISEADITCENRRGSAADDYAQTVRQIDTASPARFNADPSRLFEASGSAGKIMVFAVRLDTFPASAKTAVYYVGTNDAAELEELRRRFLSHARNLPVSAEYIHRDAFRIAYQYGKDMVWAIRALGTNRLPWLYRAKDRVDLIGRRIGIARPLSDRLLQFGARLLPQHLPRRLRTWHARFEHHLVLKMADAGIAEAESELTRLFPSASGEAFLCTPQEADLAMLHRFAVAGAAVRYRAVHGDRAGPLVSLDVALRRDERDWFEVLPPQLEAQIEAKLYYGHFFCHVFHQDYLLHAGCDADRFEHELLALLDQRGAEYPAEHNVGHLYPAKPALEAHYRALDPGNCLNAGVGQTSRHKNWHPGNAKG